VRGVYSIDAIYDEGAILYMINRLSDAATGEAIADVGMAAFLRGDGGSGEGKPKPCPRCRPTVRRTSQSTCQRAPIRRCFTVFRGTTTRFMSTRASRSRWGSNGPSCAASALTGWSAAPY
jgi:hypothetical protein